MNKLINIPDEWYLKLRHVIENPKFLDLAKVIAELRTTHPIVPSREEIFKSFQATNYPDIRVVILSTEPFHNVVNDKPIATGLPFVSADKNYMHPSVRMIYERIKTDFYENDLTFPIDLDFNNWHKQGVLMLNTSLTTEVNNPNAHLDLWREFISEVIKVLNEGFATIFLLWGSNAQSFAPLINEKAHYILNCSHPLSGIYEDSWECDHFKKVNEILQLLNGDSIEWLTLPPGITATKDIHGLNEEL